MARMSDVLGARTERSLDTAKRALYSLAVGCGQGSGQGRLRGAGDRLSLRPQLLHALDQRGRTAIDLELSERGIERHEHLQRGFPVSALVEVASRP